MGWMESPTEMDETLARNGFPYLGRLPTADTEPKPEPRAAQAFWVELNADSDPLRPHFHRVPQFQFAVLGHGTIGRSPLAPGVVQYADAVTPYGPIRPGEKGLAFITLRSSNDSGAFYMPESRTVLQELLASIEDPSVRRNFTVDLGAEPLPAPTPAGAAWRDVRADDDGLRIAVRDLAADEHWRTPMVGGSGGYLVVVTGSLAEPEGVWHPGSFDWQAPGTTADLVAGAGGARVGLLQLPA